MTVKAGRRRRMNSGWILSGLLLSFSIGASALAKDASAQTIWMRAKAGISLRDEAVLLAAQRVLLGEADEVQMFEVRSALVSLSRGRVRDGRLLVLLMRLRRELHLQSTEESRHRLRAALKGNLPRWYRMLGTWEESLLAAGANEYEEAHRAATEALSFAWRGADRAALHTIRGFCSLELRQDKLAKQDFSLAVHHHDVRNPVAQGILGLALLAILDADLEQLTLLSENYESFQAGSARESGRSVLEGLPLSADTRHAAELFIRWTRLRGQLLRGAGDTETASELLREEIEFCAEAQEAIGPMSAQFFRLLDKSCGEAEQRLTALSLE